MQAILILAHKNLKNVIHLADLLSEKFLVYVHCDKKMNINEQELKKLSSSKIKFYSKYDIKWGSYNIVLATVFLAKKALKNPNITYFHLISGQDFPAQPIADIYNFFEENDQIYLNYWKALDMKKKGEPEIWWVKYYFNYDQVNRRTFYGKVYHRILLLLETILRIDKLKHYGIPDEAIYAGQQWFDIPRAAMQFVIDKFDSDKKLQKVLSTSFCSDEIWMQTILCNSVYKDKINKNIHRYILEEKRYNSLPAILDESDYNKIMSSRAFWIRKIDFPYSAKLVEQLEHSFKGI